jgi:hypothetical protein
MGSGSSRTTIFKKAQEAYESCPQEPVYVIMDSCESLVPSESYTPKEFDPFGRYIRWISDRGSAVEVIDHARKDTKETQGMNLLEKLYGSIAKGKVADIAVFLDGTFKEGRVVAKWAKFRGNFPPSLEIGFTAIPGLRCATCWVPSSRQPSTRSHDGSTKRVRVERR